MCAHTRSHFLQDGGAEQLVAAISALIDATPPASIAALRVPPWPSAAAGQRPASLLHPTLSLHPSLLIRLLEVPWISRRRRQSCSPDCNSAAPHSLCRHIDAPAGGRGEVRQSSDGQVWLPGGGQVSEDLITPAATAAKRLAEAAATERAVSLTACSCSRDSPWGLQL